MTFVYNVTVGRTKQFHLKAQHNKVQATMVSFITWPTRKMLRSNNKRYYLVNILHSFCATLNITCTRNLQTRSRKIHISHQLSKPVCKGSPKSAWESSSGSLVASINWRTLGSDGAFICNTQTDPHTHTHTHTVIIIINEENNVALSPTRSSATAEKQRVSCPHGGMVGLDPSARSPPPPLATPMGMAESESHNVRTSSVPSVKRTLR